MPSLAIDLDPDTLARLDAQAAAHGRSAAKEARRIVENGLGPAPADDSARLSAFLIDGTLSTAPRRYPHER